VGLFVWLLHYIDFSYISLSVIHSKSKCLTSLTIIPIPTRRTTVPGDESNDIVVGSFVKTLKLHYGKQIEDWRKGPMGLASAQQAFVHAKGRNDPMIPPLPDGWKEDTDDATNILFFFFMF
jgi:hypothetical protein